MLGHKNPEERVGICLTGPQRNHQLQGREVHNADGAEVSAEAIMEETEDLDMLEDIADIPTVYRRRELLRLITLWFLITKYC